jgi:hypothetical protein
VVSGEFGGVRGEGRTGLDEAVAHGRSRQADLSSCARPARVGVVSGADNPKSALDTEPAQRRQTAGVVASTIFHLNHCRDLLPRYALFIGISRVTRFVTRHRTSTANATKHGSLLLGNHAEPLASTIIDRLLNWRCA